MTNFEHIKNMSVDEMANKINERTYGCILSFACPCGCSGIPEDCVSEIKEWLESEVEDDA